jgi:hypothetical protein
MVPAVHVYRWMGPDVPPLAEVAGMELLPAKYWPRAYIGKQIKAEDFMLDLMVSSEGQIPKGSLTFLGNMPGDDLFPFPGSGDSERLHYSGYARVAWKDFERSLLDQYFAWEAWPGQVP